MLNNKRFVLSASLVALMAIGGAGFAYAAPGDAPSMIGEIVVKVRAGMSQPEINALADSANCTVLHSIPYCPNYYLFRLKGTEAQSSAAIGHRTAILQAQSSSAELDAAITKLKTNNGIVAEPNFVVTKDSVPLHQGGLAKSFSLNQQTPVVIKQNAKRSGRGRATAPPTSITAIPNDPLYAQQYGLTLIRMPELYAAMAGTRQVIVGVADTGLDIGHPDFVRPDGTNIVLGGQNFVDDDQTTFQDLEGHGTHVAGTVAASTNNGVGVSSVAGWARNGIDVRLKIARVLGLGGGTNAEVYGGIGYLIDQNVDVINLSLGGRTLIAGGTPPQIAVDTINRGLAAGVTIVAAAGNSSADNDRFPNFPSDIPGVVKVTSVGRDRVLASYSNYGGPVTVAAPGGDQIDDGDVGIVSTWPRGAAKESPQLGLPVGYDSINGTSMASPHVAGVAALLIAVGAPRNPATILTTLHDSAQTLPDDIGGVKYGGGLVDAYSAALPYLDPAFSLAFSDATSSTTTTSVDLGATYTNQPISFSITAVGVTRQPAAGGARLQIYTANYPATLVREYLLNTTGGFTIPTTLPTGTPKSTPVTASIPDTGQITDLPPGRYRIELRLGDTVVGTRFAEIVSRTQPSGRALFSVPFQTRIADATSPEQTLFGTGASFSLARYNPLRLPGELDYALFQSIANGRRDTGASFAAVAPDGRPLSYSTSNQTVSIAPVGLGYWLNLNSAVTLNTVGSTVADAVAIRLFASGGGWNQIGAPYINSTAWATTTVVTPDGRSYSMADAIKESIIASALIGYRNGDYFYQVYPEGTLEPFNGYWVRAFRDCTLVVAPTGTTSRAVRMNVSTRAASALPPANGWRGRLVASVAGDVDGQNYFGQSRGAKVDGDALDVAKPPSGAGHAYVRFLTPVGAGRSVANAFDMRPADASQQEWTAAVSTDRTNADVTLRWDNIGGAPRRLGLILTDTATGRTIDMRAQSSYVFRSGEAGSTREFKIATDTRQSAGPVAITGVAVVSGGRAVNGGLSVRFNTTRAANIVGRVKTVGGRVVSLLTGSTRSEGTTAANLRWDGKTGGAPAPAGPYLLEITARTDDGQTATYTQPFLSNQ